MRDRTFKQKSTVCAVMYTQIKECTYKTIQVTAIEQPSYGPRREKTCLRGFANNKGADQPAHPRRLISAFVISFFGKFYM